MSRPIDGKVERRLTGEQAALVRDNLGLVGVHLRKRVVGSGPSLPRDQWDDLFQEGCVGLIEAALRFRAERGIAFAAFALPRIRTAVDRAFVRKVVPARRRRMRRAARRHPERPPEEARGSALDTARGDVQSKTPRSARPLCHGSNVGHAFTNALSIDAARSLLMGVEGGVTPAASSTIVHGQPLVPPLLATLGDRLRARFVCAVRRAAATLVAADRGTRRSDRAVVVAALVEERFLVARGDARRPLREVARRLGCPYTRVAMLHQRLRFLIVERLGGDAAYLLLRHYAQREGVDTGAAMDEDIETELIRDQCVCFLRTFHSAGERVQGTILRDLCRFSGEKWHKWVEDCFARLPAAARDELLGEASCLSAAQSLSKGPKG